MNNNKIYYMYFYDNFFDIILIVFGIYKSYLLKENKFCLDFFYVFCC